MTSVERVIEYIDLKPEESKDAKNVNTIPPRWPTGGIVFNNLSLRYSSTAPWVLKNINISIEPNEKVFSPSIESIDSSIDFRSVLLVEPVLEKVRLFNLYFVWLK